MSDRDLERGPQGDHGQHGDPGVAGPTGPTGPQGEPGRDWKIGKWAVLRALAFVLVATAAIYASAATFQIADDAREIARTANRAAAQANVAAAQAKAALRASEKQRVEARDQICEGDEREHLNAVQRVDRTYDYLKRLPVADRDDSITRAILRQLPDLEREASQDTAPKFCDEPNVGLPEPDVKAGPRPKIVTTMLRAEQQRAAAEQG